MSQDIYQIIYLSKTEEDLSDDVLEKILTQAQKNNSAQGLTGILLYENKEFLQVLEGGYDAVKAALSRISNDPRHNDMVLLYDGRVNKRAFAKWKMGFARLETAQRAKLEQLNGFFDNEDDLSNLQSGLLRVFVTGFLLGRMTGAAHGSAA